MAKQLNVNLAFSADTSKAKNAIQSLINDLNTLSSTSGLNKDLEVSKVKPSEVNESVFEYAWYIQFSSVTSKHKGLPKYTPPAST